MKETPDNPMPESQNDVTMESLRQIEGQHTVIDRLTEEVNSGRVKCVMVQILYDDATSYNLNSGGTMIEQVGLLESMKYDLLNATRAETTKWEEDDGE